MEFAPAIVEKLRTQAARFDELTDLLASSAMATGGKRFPALLRERGQLEHAALLCRRLDVLVERRRDAERILGEPRPDPELAELAREDLAGLAELEQALDREIKALLVSDPEDERSKVIVEIRAGTGGDEATLFAADLNRVYRRFVEGRRWRVEELGAQTSEVGGFKEIVFGVQGPDAWRLLRHESGGHRVQRVPATENQGRIHTSAVTVAVLPEAEEAEIDVKTEDLRIDTMRAGGAGGQHVNKTESAVRITHLPSGVVVVCQDEKSQHKNKARAMRILKSRLLDAERQRIHAERAAERKIKVGSGDRSQRVRTYNYPQNRVTDHRLGENYSLEQVVAGKLDPILEALEEQDREERIKNL
jgi:peptide chain release factor 1